MSLLLRYGRYHWQALVVLGLLAWRLGREGLHGNIVLWICVGLAALGMAMNLIVIGLNGKMPVAVKEEEGGEEDRPHYRPIDESTRLAVLSDWIPVGNLMVSPGDVLLLIAVGFFLLRSILGIGA